MKTTCEIRSIYYEIHREFHKSFNDLEEAKKYLIELREYWKGKDYIKFELVEITERIVEV